jgi:NAD(P)H-dependent flavin oxidoreductase YrpB (nitropropane dioxygenase family)
MAAALALGAKGVWCGSIWLTTIESGCLPVVKHKLIAAKSEDTVRSRALSGKPSRMLRTAWVQEWARADTPEPLAFPLQPVAAGRYLHRIEQAAGGHVSPDSGAGALITTPVGQVVGMLSGERSCRQVIISVETTLADDDVEKSSRA